MSVMMYSTEMSMSEYLSSPLFRDDQKVRDCDGIRLNVGDVVVEAVMTANGVQCPKMSASPEEYDIYMYGRDVLESARLGELTDMHLTYTILGIQTLLGDVSEFVLVRSLTSEKFVLFHMSELAWVRDYFNDFE